MPRSRGYKIFSCSTQLSMEFQLLIKGKMLKMKAVLAFNLSDVLILLITVKCQQLLAFSIYEHDRFRA